MYYVYVGGAGTFSMIIPTETLKKGMTDIENVGYERDEVPKKIAAISQLKSKFLRVKVPESSGPRRAEMTSEEELNVERGDGREGSCCSQRASEADRVSCPRRFPPYLPLSVCRVSEKGLARLGPIFRPSAELRQCRAASAALALMLGTVSDVITSCF